MTSRRRNERVVITGASRGIGRAAALALAQQGRRVVLAARSEPALRALAEEIVRRGGEAEPAPVDLLDDASVASWAEHVLSSGPIDVLVNNAGSLDQTLFADQADAARRAEMELNYFGALRATRAFLPSLVQAGRGLIVNVSSMLGSVGTPTTANYSASKAALEAFSHALRGELAPHGVRVTVFVARTRRRSSGNARSFAASRARPSTSWRASSCVRSSGRPDVTRPDATCRWACVWPPGSRPSWKGS